MVFSNDQVRRMNRLLSSLRLNRKYCFFLQDYLGDYLAKMEDTELKSRLTSQWQEADDKRYAKLNRTAQRPNFLSFWIITTPTMEEYNCKLAHAKTFIMAEKELSAELQKMIVCPEILKTQLEQISQHPDFEFIE